MSFEEYAWTGLLNCEVFACMIGDILEPIISHIVAEYAEGMMLYTIRFGELSNVLKLLQIIVCKSHVLLLLFVTVAHGSSFFSDLTSHH